VGGGDVLSADDHGAHEFVVFHDLVGSCAVTATRGY
jgi:hypothetical protein